MALVKLNNRGVRSATAFGSITGLGSMIFIKKQTASSSSTIDFVDGTSDVVLDNTYKEYIFTWNNIHPATNNVGFQIGFRDGSTDYDATKTTTWFQASHNEADNTTGVSYEASQDIAQGTGFQNLVADLGSDNDQATSGYLHLFNPSGTVGVKHFIAVGQSSSHDDYTNNPYVAGYCNVTAAIDGVQFKMSSGNIDAGDICLYGIS